MKIHEFSFGHCRVEVEERFPVSSTGSTLVFLHGRMANGDFWGPILERFAERFRCLIVHFPGFGRSLSFNHRSLSLQDSATLVCQVLERLVGKGDQAALIGHDFGGVIAQLCGIRCAEKISSLTLMNSSTFLGECHSVVALRGWKFRGWARRLLRSSVWRDRDCGVWLEDQWKNRVARAELLDAIREMEDSWPGPYERRFWREELKKIRLPVLLLWGAFDELNPVEEGLGLLKELPSAGFFQNDCGHWPQLENPDWVAEKIREFLFALGRAVWGNQNSPIPTIIPVRKSLSR